MPWALSFYMSSSTLSLGNDAVSRAIIAAFVVLRASCGRAHRVAHCVEHGGEVDVGPRDHQGQLLPLSLRHAERVSSEKRRVSKLKGLAAKASVG